MKFQTQIPINKAENQIDYSSKLVLLGSCFAENIGNKLAFNKFQSVLNPFGVLFHSKAIENLVSKAITKDYYAEEDVFFSNERWHSFDVHSNLSNVSKQELIFQLNRRLDDFLVALKNATHIIITLGTSWVYEHKQLNKTVANCHKVPQKAFNKRLLSVEEISISLEKIVRGIRLINKGVHFVFTVSPVRHLKDGFVENQQSKAHLIAGAHQALLRLRSASFDEKEVDSSKQGSMSQKGSLLSEEDNAVDETEGTLEQVENMLYGSENMLEVDRNMSEVSENMMEVSENMMEVSENMMEVNENMLSGDETYFPAYEILMDELRDYRFYKEDMIHPNSIAIEYIWERFIESQISEKAYGTMGMVETIQKGLNHKPFNPKSELHQKFLKSLEEKKKALKNLYSFIDFG